MFLSHASLDYLNSISKNSLIEHLGIKYTDIGKDRLVASMPVNNKTCQPHGHLHGGASLALAESVGSAASVMTVDPERYSVSGLEINANHIKSVNKGMVHATAKLLHLGKTIHVWEVRVVDDNNDLVTVCRLTNLILMKRK